MDDDFVDLMFMLLRAHSNRLGNAVLRRIKCEETLGEFHNSSFYKEGLRILQNEIESQKQAINNLCDRLESH